MSKWKENNIINELESLIEKNNNWFSDDKKIKFIFRTGTQPPLNLVFYNKREFIINDKIFTHYKGCKKLK